jgi:F-type H+-transporting ATPase subunit b|tara:strand:+ start:84 stop:578 length:495 start_codon:yes stop_codon:yes gene_type:complete
MPQLNPEFFISQLFWLVISFTFLFIFLWRISLPRISTVLEKRSNKINEDIEIAKLHQTKAEEIQKSIDNQLREAKLETADLIKSTNQSLQDHATKELDKLDKLLNRKLDESSSQIEKNKSDSLNQINDQIYEITKLTLSRISSINVNDEDIKDVVKNVKQEVLN